MRKVIYENSAPKTSDEKSKGKIKVKCSNTKNGKRAWDKRHFCVYCERPYFKIARHLEDKHKKELEVDTLLQLLPDEKDSNETLKTKRKLRMSGFLKLRKRGDYNHNIYVLQKGTGELVVERCPPQEVPYTSYLPCEHCLSFYFKKDLHRHISNCKSKVQTTQVKGMHKVQSSASMLLPVRTEVSADLRKILSRMKVDEISNCVKNDVTIVKYGNALCKKHYNNDDQTYHISNKLRELGRLFLKMKMSQNVKSFKDIIKPALFPKVVTAFSELCGWDEDSKKIATPSLGIKLGQLLSKICYLLKGEAIISSNTVDKTNADEFNQLLEMKWNDEIAKVSRTELECRKWNKPNLLPLTEDLLKLKVHITEVQRNAMKVLATEKSNLKEWRMLASSTLASLILFNRRREGEPSKLDIDTFKRLRHDVPNDEIKASLTPFELKLCECLKRIELRGKRGRKIPLIVTQRNEQAIKVLINVRTSVGVSNENKYVFSVPTTGSVQHIRGNDALRKHVILSNLKCPEAVTSTKLRKHIATLSQLLNLEERQLEMLATYMGHDISVHREYYRLPENTLQLAKCGKLLVLMDQGKVGQFAGKTLDEIDIDLNG